jgi:NAD(P)-dependent dehydrogenase (short-subunit alcohol dehydrogenase family)
MKTLVIGHTNGIGKAIYKRLSKSDATSDVVGLSKSTGFDINIRNTDFNYDQFDCIVLNSYDLFTSQLNTMMEIAEHLDKEKLIVVIGSTSAYKTNPTDLYWAGYAVEKAAIIKLGTDLNTMGYNVAMVSPGTVDTHRNEHKDIDKLPTKTISKIVENIVEQYKKGVLIEHTVVRTTKK